MAQGYFDWTLTGGKDPASLGFGPGWGGGETSNPAVQQAMAGMQQFQQMYQNLLGTGATPEALASFAQKALSGAVNAPGDLGFSDTSNLVNNFIQSNYGPQMAQHQQDLASQQLQKTQQTIQDLVSKQTQAQTADLTNPNSPTYQAFSGLMNNMGITPDSGAFQAGLGGQIGQFAANDLSAALGGVSLPAIGGIQGMTNMPMNFAQGNSNLSHLNQLGDFGLEQQIAQMLQNQMQPSGFEKGLGYANTASSIYGNLMKGGASAAQGAGAMQSTSYVCKELIKRGFICDQDMDDFHVHIMPAMFKKGRAFWKYAMDGKKLVDAANSFNVNWDFFKPLLFDRVMEEPDPCKAVDLYAMACKMLALAGDPSLWDERVMRTSFLDSLTFLPRLLCYRPFLEALWKCIKFKTRFLVDKPSCEVRHGSR